MKCREDWGDLRPLFARLDGPTSQQCEIFNIFNYAQLAGYFFASVEEKADGRRRSCRLPRLLSICAKDGPVRDGDDTRKEGRE